MTYTVRFAHLERASELRIGECVKRGRIVGRMGSSGQSTAPHLHIDCVEGEQSAHYTLATIEAGSPKASPRQLNYFVDNELFGSNPIVTTYFADPLYQAKRNKLHSGYDIVPAKKPFDIHWNRSVDGRVVRLEDDPEGYGHCVYIAFDV